MARTPESRPGGAVSPATGQQSPSGSPTPVDARPSAHAVNVEVHVVGDGDGWLAVDIADWQKAKFPEPDPALTDSLGKYISSSSDHRAYRTRFLDWAHERFGQVSGPGIEPVSFSANEASLLNEDLRVEFIGVPLDGMDRILAVVDYETVHVLPPNWDREAAVNWSQAHGVCPEGHRFKLEDGCHLHSYTSQAGDELAELCRKYDPDDGGEAGYVACPDCPGDAQPSPIRFEA